jgi:hypothetical protein
MELSKPGRDMVTAGEAVPYCLIGYPLLLTPLPQVGIMRSYPRH